MLRWILLVLCVILPDLIEQTQISKRFYRALYAKLLDPELLSASKPALFLNLLYKVLKRDSNVSRAAAFLKRILQVCFSHRPNFVCGSLILLSEVMRAQPVLFLMLQKHEGTPLAPGDTQDDTVYTGDNVKASGGSSPEAKQAAAGVYDATKRDPAFACADMSCLWELSVLRKHFHPSVQAFADTLYQGKPIKYSGDPLNDFTNSAFLDRFVYRNPKQSKEGTTRREQRLQRKTKTPSLLVNSDEFRKLGENQVSAGDIFFHRYFKQKARLDAEKYGGGEDDDDETLEEAADRIVEAEIARVGDYDDDDDAEFSMSDLSSDSGGGEVSEEEDYVPVGPPQDQNGEGAGLVKAGGAGTLVEEGSGGSDSDSDSDSKEERAALRAMMKGESDSDSAEDFDDFDLGESSSEADSAGDSDVSDTPKRKRQKKSPFASAEEFSEILEQASQKSDEQQNLVHKDGQMDISMIYSLYFIYPRL